MSSPEGDPPQEPPQDPLAPAAPSEAAAPQTDAANAAPPTDAANAAPPESQTYAASIGELYPASVETNVASLQPASTASGTVVVDESILPATYDDNQLREAVGVAPAERRRQAKVDRDSDEGEPTTRRSRRTMTIVALTLIVGLAITTLIFLGRANSQRYAIRCSTDHVTAEHGRSFPPWGTQPMSGPGWKPIALPPNAECKPRETENPAELEGWYLGVLIDRASTTLTTPNLVDAVPSGPAAGHGGANPLDVVSDQLQQALLLSRSPDHRDERKEVERLLGDVQYWRAFLRLRDASTALTDASRQFEQAAQQRPRHVTDAAAWASFLKQLADELKAGPGSVPAVTNVSPSPAGSDHPSAPMGTALPVEGDASGSDTAAPPSAPDAGVPSGGVLL